MCLLNYILVADEARDCYNYIIGYVLDDRDMAENNIELYSNLLYLYNRINAKGSWVYH
jgi:hypothetical protein